LDQFSRLRVPKRRPKKSREVSRQSAELLESVERERRQSHRVTPNLRLRDRPQPAGVEHRQTVPGRPESSGGSPAPASSALGRAPRRAARLGSRPILARKFARVRPRD
jgi:hypothetical protein